MASRQGKISFCLLCLMTLMIISQITDAQFFTKSSKSIPRMGRRSASGPSASLGAGGQDYRRSLIDSLVDQYGPDLVEILETQAKASEAKRASQGEVALRNDQPIDLVRSQAELGDSPIEVFSVDRSVGQNMARDERSLHPSPAAGGLSALGSPMASALARNNQQLRPENNRESSLALRAFNTNRLLQHLASGQPLLTSYDMLVYGGQDKQLPKQQQRRQDNGEVQKYLSYEDK